MNNPRETNKDFTGSFSKLLCKGLGKKVKDIKRLPGGINSTAFKISADHNDEYFGKAYRATENDSRERLATEFNGLTFLWKNGLRNIPEPLLADEKEKVAIYSFIKGSKIEPGEITIKDIDEAVDFTSRLHLLSISEDAEDQPIASEACFSIQEYINCVDNRTGNIEKSIREEEVFNSLRDYLRDKFMPFLDEVKREIIKKAEKMEVDINRRISKEERTLSASDFGFHNAIRTQDGKVFFVDFEYYGWDDPAKMISDFYLQPAVPVPFGYRKHFFEKIENNYKEKIELKKRVSIIYPVLGLKWCLIMLNAFLHYDDYKNDGVLLSNQLKKAEKKMKEIKYEVKTGGDFLGT